MFNMVRSECLTSIKLKKKRTILNKYVSKIHFLFNMENLPPSSLLIFRIVINDNFTKKEINFN